MYMGLRGLEIILDTDFSELNKPKKKNLDGFFKDYEEIIL